METGARGQSVFARVGGIGSRSWCAALLASVCLLFTACIPSSDSPGPASDLANLSGLELADSAQQKVGLSPAFSGDATNYTADVGGAIANITIRPTAINAAGNTTIRIQKPDGSTTPITSGQVSPALPVNFGTNSFTVTVDAPGATKAYVVVVTRGANANLNALSLSAGGLTPAFQPATTDYTAKTGFTTPTTTVTATLSDTSSTLTVNGQAADSGQATAPIQLNTGSTKIAIVVRSQNGQTKTYTVDVVRAGTSDLSKLEVQGHSVSPGFDPSNTGTYNAAVPFGEGSANIVATAADSSATITINGQSATSGQKFPVSLSTGVNSYSIVVTGPSVAPKTYSLNITRAPASTNAKLSGLSVDEGQLQPGFSSNTFGYVVTVGSGTGSVHVTATTDDSASSLNVNNQGASSGQQVTVGLTGGVPSTTVIPIVVTAQNGAAQSYTITVNKAAPASGNANLQSLAVPPASISFNQATTTYNTSVPNGTGSVTVNAVVADGGSTMTINGQAVQSPSNLIVPLNVGSNTITVQVRAAAGNTRDYVVNVTRGAAASTNAKLSNLSVDEGPLQPGFSSDTFGYTVSVETNTSTVHIAATTAVSTSSVTINNQAVSSGQKLSVGLTSGAPSTTFIPIVVTAQSGATQSYTITVNKAAPVSTNANLQSLGVPPASISFNPSTTTYNTSVPNGTAAVTVNAVVADSGSTMTISTATINSQAIPSPSNFDVPLNVGSNTITIHVRAPAGNTRDYVVNVTRGAQASSDATLTNLTVAIPPAPGVAVQGFSSGSGGPYSVTLPVGTSLTIVAVKRSNDNAKVLFINGNQDTPTSAQVSLAAGPSTKTVNIVVTAEDTVTTKTYTVDIKVEAQAPPPPPPGP